MRTLVSTLNEMRNYLEGFDQRKGCGLTFQKDDSGCGAKIILKGPRVLAIRPGRKSSKPSSQLKTGWV